MYSYVHMSSMWVLCVGYVSYRDTLAMKSRCSHWHSPCTHTHNSQAHSTRHRPPTHNLAYKAMHIYTHTYAHIHTSAYREGRSLCDSQYLCADDAPWVECLGHGLEERRGEQGLRRACIQSTERGFSGHRHGLRHDGGTRRIVGPT
jgi:hypothetical protein